MQYSSDFDIYTGTWVSKNSIIHEEDYEHQQQYITYLPVKSSNGQLAFLYDNDIAAYEDFIERKINKIALQNHEISICNEIFYTTKIEGAHTTIARTQQIHNGAPLASRQSEDWVSEKMVQNSFQATKYLNLIHGRQLGHKDLRKLWELTIPTGNPMGF